MNQFLIALIPLFLIVAIVIQGFIIDQYNLGLISKVILTIIIILLLFVYIYYIYQQY